MSTPSNPDGKTRLEALVEFPTEFTFRVVGEASAGLREQTVSGCQTQVGRAPSRVTTASSGKGNFESIRATLRVERAEEVERLYAALRAIPGVRLVL